MSFARVLHRPGIVNVENVHSDCIK
jgi:hypothetical protein